MRDGAGELGRNPSLGTRGVPSDDLRERTGCRYLGPTVLVVAGDHNDRLIGGLRLVVRLRLVVGIAGVVVVGDGLDEVGELLLALLLGEAAVLGGVPGGAGVGEVAGAAAAEAGAADAGAGVADGAAAEGAVGVGGGAAGAD
ncbi:hypothetical protein ACFYUY_09155 [Kitasatospora sp. NPDC004745]|uniref:hypothetical protein n=1 Tax=Kitasatospora sp. NPDC004745 TaxID=3364019 RepID=UPI00368FF6E0